MCGRYNLTASEEQVSEHFQLAQIPGFATSYNIPPGQKILTVIRSDDGGYESAYLYWGLIPFWSKETHVSKGFFNARAETVAEKPSFRTAFRQHRCLIPATGFYEWQVMESGKQAYHIFRRDHGLFAFAGLWDCNQQTAPTLYSCTIITTVADTLMAPIHQRMPVIIPKQDYDRWLDKQTSLDALQALLDNSAYHGMAAVRISDHVNNPLHDDKQCLA